MSDGIKILGDFAPIPMSAGEVAHLFLAEPGRRWGRYELHLPSSEELLGEVLKHPERFVTQGRFEAAGIFVVDHGDKVVAVDRNRHAVVERREFPSLQRCFETLLPLFRRFLNAEFHYFAGNLIWDSSLFPSQWRYTVELTLDVLQKSLQSPDAVRSAPTREYPSWEEVIALIVPHESKLLDDGHGDGAHITKTASGYAVRWYERGQLGGEEQFSRFEEAIRRLLSDFMPSARLLPRERFHGLSDLEYSSHHRDPPV
jgi:hypothetical protein